MMYQYVYEFIVYWSSLNIALSCMYRWWTGPWQHCSVTCGTNGLHKRTVICVRSLGSDEQIALEDKSCQGEEKPIEVEPCHHKDPCPGTAEWTVGEWTTVDKIHSYCRYV